MLVKGTGAQDVPRPIWQIMASGMHNSTAVGLEPCDGGDADGALCCGFDRDDAGLRGPNRTCSVFGDPNFGVIDLDWIERSIRLAVLRGDGGGVARGADGTPLEATISMDTCAEG